MSWHSLPSLKNCAGCSGCGRPLGERAGRARLRVVGQGKGNPAPLALMNSPRYLPPRNARRTLFHDRMPAGERWPNAARRHPGTPRGQKLLLAGGVRSTVSGDKTRQARYRLIPTQPAAGQLIRHRKVGRRASASLPEGPGSMLAVIKQQTLAKSRCSARRRTRPCRRRNNQQSTLMRRLRELRVHHPATSRKPQSASFPVRYSLFCKLIFVLRRRSKISNA